MNALTHRLHRRRRRQATAEDDRATLTTFLLIGSLLWSYLSMIFDLLSETVSWERWEGTIEYTFMSPASRATQLLGMGIYAIVYGIAADDHHARRDLALLRSRARRTPTTLGALADPGDLQRSRWSGSAWSRR